MGFLFMSLKEMDIANKYFLAAAQLDSKRYLAQYYAAQFIYKRGGDYNSAENYLRKAIAINPSFAPAYDLLSCVLATQDAKLTEALRCAKMAATLEPSVLRHRINIATIQAKMGNLDEALSLGEHLLPLAQTAEDQNAIHSLLLFVKNQRERTREEAQRANALREERRKIEARRKEGEELERRFRIEEAARKAKASAKPVKTGAAGILKGSIKSVQCSGSAALEIDLSVNGKLRRLRADNYYRVQFWAIDAKGKSGFQPCTELQGKRVEVEFLSVSGQEYSGLIKSISIEK
jgi:tetratricopeptide (TPR) repeat protein